VTIPFGYRKSSQLHSSVPRGHESRPPDHCYGKKAPIMQMHWRSSPLVDTLNFFHLVLHTTTYKCGFSYFDCDRRSRWTSCCPFPIRMEDQRRSTSTESKSSESDNSKWLHTRWIAPEYSAGRAFLMVAGRWRPIQHHPVFTERVESIICLRRFL